MAKLYRSDIVDVDISKPLLRTYAGIVLATGDMNANRFGANINRAGEPVRLTGCDVSGYFIRPNMETVFIKGATDGNTAYVDLPESCYANEGAFSLTLKISGTNITQTVRVVDGYIRLTQTGTLIDPGEVVPSLEELFAQMAAMEDATEEARTVVQEAAPPITCHVEDSIITVNDSAGARAFPAMSLQGRSTQDGTPTLDAPVDIVSIGEENGVTLEVCGRNLYDLNNLRQPSATNAQSTYTVTEDGWIDVTSQKAYDYLYHDRFFAAGVPYTARYEVEVYDRPADSTGNTVIGIGIGVQQTKNITANGSYTYVVNVTPATSGVLSVRTMANVASAVPAKVRFRVTCVAGKYTAATMPAWEAYNAQKLTLPYTLRGIPVASGGNYTDADGQRWIADEIDFARGVHVQRCGYLDSYASETISTAYISSTGALTNGAEIVYVLDTPVETALTAEEMTAYATLRSRYPVTCAAADGAWVSMTYIADTKLYIDNKFAELAAQIINA